jgi:hypothetical protein
MAAAPCGFAAELRPLFNAKSIEIRDAARKRAEELAPVFAELAGLSLLAMAEELNRRGIETPKGGQWYAQTVKRVRARLG